MKKNGYNKRKQSKTFTGVTPEKVIAWAHRKAKIPVKQTAQILGISITQVCRYNKEMDEFVGKDFDINILRNNLYGLYGLATQALRDLLVDGNPKTVSDYFNGLGIWTNKYEHDVKGIDARSTAEMVAQLEGLGIVSTGTEAPSPDDSERAKIPS